MIAPRIDIDRQLCQSKSMNRLASEQSPYLLKHASNPVDWWAWGDEAHRAALELDRPIFLSIGYATCHWCNVMEEESFEDEEVAGLLNSTFICIKVDREERPDVDGIYMAACNLLTGAGGWPLTVLLTPELKPFHAATYIPKRTRFGRIGLMELIPRVAGLWAAQRDEVMAAAEGITRSLAEAVQHVPGEEPDERALDAAFEAYLATYDSENGGFGGAMKFPMPHVIGFLLGYHDRTGRAEALTMATSTLDAMLRGGIRDHLAGGFHRYSTDPRWRVPHFEKMLYDQALIMISLSDAYLATANPGYLDAAKETAAFAMAHLRDPDGGFYTALGADSGGGEGAYYLWAARELREILNAQEYALAARVFGIEEAGNFVDSVTGERPGTNVLYRAEYTSDPRLEAVREKLLEARDGRPKPDLDDKVLADLNGLMIAALSALSRSTGDTSYAEAASRAAGFVLDRMRDDKGALIHGWRRGGRSQGRPSADDYAFMIWGLIELYLATFEIRWLTSAIELQRDMIRGFWDEQGGGFYFTPYYGEHGIVRKKEAHDAAVPSSNSVAAWDLIRLGRIVGDADWEQKAARTMAAFSDSIGESPTSHAMMLTALGFTLGPSHEAVVAGRSDAPDTRAMIAGLWAAYLPNAIVLHLPTEEPRPGIARYARYMDGMGPKDGRAAAYICTGYACQRPVTDPAEALGMLRPLKA